MSNVETFDLTGAYQRAKWLTTPGKKDPYGEAEGVVHHPDQLAKHVNGSLVILCKEIADLLVRRYPGWAWAVQPQQFGGVINILNLHLHPTWGFTIVIDDIQNDMRRKAAVRAGHEILRRFRMPDRMNPTVLAEAPRDAVGNCIPDISDMATKKERQDAEIALGLATGRMEIIKDDNGHSYLKVKY